MLGHEHADVLAAAVVDDDRAVARGVDRRARAAQQLREPARVGAGHPHAARARGQELLQRRLRDRAPARDHHDLVGGLRHLRQHVAGDEHGAALRGHRAQEVAQPADALRVQAVGGLVEHQHARVAQQGGREAEPLAHAERVAARPPVGRVREVDELQQLVDARVGRPPPRAPASAGGCARCGWDAASRRRGRRRPCARGPPGPRTGCPSTVAVPSVGRMRPSSARSVVVLPAPLGPRKPTSRPGSTLKLRSSTATVSP